MENNQRLYSVLLDTVEPNDRELTEYLTANGITTSIAGMSPNGDYEIEFMASKVKTLEDMITMFWCDDYLFEFIEEVS